MFNPTTEKIDPDPYQGLSLSIRTAQPKAAKLLTLTAVFLEAADIDAFIELQNKVRDQLQKDGKEHHLKERNAEELKAHLKAGHYIIGVKTESGRLVAQCILAFAGKPGVKNLEGYPISDNERDVTAVVQSVCVDPGFKGNGLAGMMLQMVNPAAAMQGCIQVDSAIADDNDKSLRAFEKAGYKKYDSGKDPVKGYDKSYFRVPVLGCDAA